MIKARLLKSSGEPVYFLGLSERNFELLKDGRPMMIDLSDLGGTDTVIIHYGANEKTILEELSREGLLPDIEWRG